MNATAPLQVLAVLDEASAAPAVLDMSAALAQIAQRQLQLVYVESAAALAAAELSATRVLAEATAHWTPFAPPDLERAWRAQALRLRQLAERASQPRAVQWSLRVTRGALRQTALALLPESDLLLVGGAAAFVPGRGSARRSVVAVIDDGSGAAQLALRLANSLARALGARLEVHRIVPARDAPPLIHADLLVVPATLAAGKALLALARVPTLLVGSEAAAPTDRPAGA